MNDQIKELKESPAECPVVPPVPSDDDDHYEAYTAYAKLLRSWFVAYGIGGPVILLSSDVLRNQVIVSGRAGIIGLLFISGVAFQILIAFVNKTLMWSIYYSKIKPKIVTKRWYKAARKICDMFWLDMLADLLTLLTFSAATVLVFLVLANVATTTE